MASKQPQLKKLNELGICGYCSQSKGKLRKNEMRLKQELERTTTAYKKQISDISASIFTQQSCTNALNELERHLESGNRQLSEENKSMKFDIVSITKENRSLKQQRKTLVRRNEILGKQVLSLSLVNKGLTDASEALQMKNGQMEEKKLDTTTLCGIPNLEILAANINLLLEKLSKFEGSESWHEKMEIPGNLEIEQRFMIEQLQKEKDFGAEELKEALLKIDELEKEITYFKEKISDEIRQEDIEKQSRKAERNLKEKTSENNVLKQQIYRLEERNRTISEFFSNECKDILHKEQQYKEKIKQLEKKLFGVNGKKSEKEEPQEKYKIGTDTAILKAGPCVSICAENCMSIDDAENLIMLNSQSQWVDNNNSNKGSAGLKKKTVSWASDVKENSKEESNLANRHESKGIYGKAWGKNRDNYGRSKRGDRRRPKKN